MKKTAYLLFIFFTISLIAKSQVTIEYSYDNAGNRISRQVIYMKTDSLINEDSLKMVAYGHFQEDLSGTSQYNQPAGELSIHVFPNPVLGVLYVKLQGYQEDRPVQIQLWDARGRQIVNKEARKPVTKLDMAGFAGGIYILRVVNSNITREWKIVKE